MQELSLKEEFFRKLVHLSSIVYPIIYWFITKDYFVVLILVLFLGVLFWDILRIKGVKLPFLKFIDKTLRDEEKNNKKFTGATFFLFSVLLISFIFPKNIVIFSIIVLVIGDTFAALVGKSYPILKITYLKKSVGGFLGFIGSSVIAAYVFYVMISGLTVIPDYVYLSIFIAAIAELLAKKINIDDNILIALVCAVFLNLG